MDERELAEKAQDMEDKQKMLTGLAVGLSVMGGIIGAIRMYYSYKKERYVDKLNKEEYL